MNSIEDKKRIIIETLNESFVDKYDFFKETIEKINNLFEKYDIDYKYDYNSFCQEYIKRCVSVIDDNPDIDLENDKYFIIYGAVAASMVYDKEKKYGKYDESE